MQRGFWGKLKKPFFVLAPMADVTDAAFRRVIAQYGKPDVMWTEFVSADGLCLADDAGKKKLLADFIYSEAERPIVAQLFTSRPEMMERAARLARELGFDGIDINMGCPDRSIEKQGAGAAMIKNPENAVAVFEAAKRGALAEQAGGIPVSIKTRLGYNKDELETWLPTLLKAKPVAITLHARTRKEMSKVDAHWDRIADAVVIRNRLSEEGQTLLIGNGDVVDLEDARKKVEESGCDGVMLGRAIFGNPWLFQSLKASEKSGNRNKKHTEGKDRESNLIIYDKVGEKQGETVPVEERLRVMVEHTKLFEELLPEKNFAIMKKHYKAYVSDFDGAKELRVELMDCQSASEVETKVQKFLSNTQKNFF